ncbi:MAG: ATP-binding protein [Clostridia bacterium]|nr:ATP-binding protein [Clostridia bacterium]
MNLLVFGKIFENHYIRSILEENASAVMADIIKFAETEAVTEDVVRECCISALANDENVLSALAQAGKKIGKALLDAALLDVKQIFDALSSCDISYTPSGNDAGFYDEYANSIKALLNAKTPDELLYKLIRHYQALGTGELAKYVAFKYDGQIVGIPEHDNITFSALVGLEYQKQVLIDNTKSFIAGCGANNILLFGDRGTGKSSSVKALLNMFCDEGLRVIEMPKAYMSKIGLLMGMLSSKPHKYIIFLDDLSFEKNEPDYKALKIAMEGQLQSIPKNVLIYATSNRRHLIRENWSDREGGEVHINDNMQETLSLSERFGISLVFSAPTQREYLHIVEELLKKKGYEMNAEIERRAIVWQMNYSGRSGRCAAQFVASYIGKH